MASEPDDANKLPPSRSYFKKTVSLQDWWLTKPQTDDGTKTIGVAGLTCTSQQSRAGRCFSSAPILKVYDLFELETVDGVCVILQGFINKDRTLESGFSSEVFNHFVIGFPPYWEEFSTSCPKRGSTTESVLTVNVAGKEGIIEGHDNFHDSINGKLLHHGSETVDMGVQDSEDIVWSNKTSVVRDSSLLEVPKEHIIKDGSEVACERCPLTSDFEDDPSLMVSPVGSSKLSKYLRVSSRRMTRSMTKMDSSKNLSAPGSVLHDISTLDKVTLVDPENLGSTNIPMKDTNDALLDNKDVNVLDRDGPSMLPAGSSSLGNTAAGNLELQNSRSCQKGNSPPSYGVDCASKENISTSEGNPDEQNLKNGSPNLSVEYGKGLTGAASHSKDMVLRNKSKQKQKDHNIVNVTEDLRNKLPQVGVFSRGKTKDADVSSESQIDSDPLDPLYATSVGVEGLVDATTNNAYFAPDVMDLKDDVVLSKTSMQACQFEKRERLGRFTRNDTVLDKEGAFNLAAARQEAASKDAIMTRSKSKRKLSSGSSCGEMAKGQHIASPKSAKSASRLGLGHHTQTSAKKDAIVYGSRERHVSTNILSPESFSGKRSRSGRMLLPSLEFWRNQTVVYDADRQVAGIKDGTYVALSSRDISKDNKD